MIHRLLPLLLGIVASACAPPAPGAPSTPAPTRSVTVQAVSPPREAVAPPAPKSGGAHLEICRIDDDLAPFEQLAAHPGQLPEGVAFQQESAPVGGDSRLAFFARIDPRSGESANRARARFQAWLQTVPLPPHRRFGLARIQSDNRYDISAQPVAWRTYVLFSACELDDSAVESARLSQALDSFGWRLSIELTRAGAEVFSALTESMLRRRLALILDGTVMLAPTVMTRIGGGRLDISIPGEDIDLPLQFASGVSIERD